MIRLFGCFTLVLNCFNICAQQTNPEVDSTLGGLDPVTVTANLRPEKSSQTGRSLFVIEGKKIQTLPIHSVDELLRYVPGIEVQARGPMGSQSDFVVRGGTFQQTLIILDGVRLNDPNTGHFSSYIPIAPFNIDRIEVLYGAASAIYGSEAVGSVIHIITKAFATKGKTRVRNIQAQLTGGAYGLLNADAGVLVSNGTSAVSLGVLTNNASGQQQRGTHGFFHNHTVSVAASHNLSDRLQLAIRSSYDNRHFAAQNFYTNFTSDTANEKVETFWNQLQLTFKTTKHLLRFSAGYKVLNDTYVFNPTSTANKSKSNLLQALITDAWKLNDRTSLTTGTQFINKKINSNDRGMHNLSQAAAFVLVNQQLGNKAFIAPALRLDWNEQGGLELVPQINVSYSVHPVMFRASAGKTIRDADFTERYNNFNKPLVTSGRIGNPQLEAERSFSYELGADYFATNSIKVSATFFQRFHNNLIDYANIPYDQMPRKDNLVPGGNYALAKNIAEVNITGADVALQVNKKLNSTDKIWGTVGFTWLHSTSSDGIPSLYISSHAKYLTNFNLQYIKHLFTFTVNGLYKQRQPQLSTANIAKVSKDYFLLNAKAEIFLIPQNLSVFVEADNLLNTEYADLLGAEMPGRWLMGGIKISLSK